MFKNIHVLLRHIQRYCGIFRTLCSFCIFRTLPFSQSLHIKNLRHIHNSVKAYSGIFKTLYNARILRTLPYSEFLAYLGPQAYSESCLYRHIQENSVLIVLTILTFLTLKIFHTFPLILEGTIFDYNGLNFSARLSLLK